MDAHEKSIYSFIIIASFVLGIIITYFFISVVYQQRVNAQLRKKLIVGELSELEKERARIAVDLHDEVGPLLSAIKLIINSFGISGEDKEALEKTNDYLDNIIQRMSEISFNLKPYLLLKKGLINTLDSYLKFIEHRNKIQTFFSHSTNFVLSEDKAISLYRIAQEVVNNSLKHANATKIYIKINDTRNKYCMIISDNGKGFDYYEQQLKNKGFGLNSISNRIQILGGTMHFDSSDRGTNYKFEIAI